MRLVTRTVAQSKPVQLFSLTAMLLVICGATNHSQTFSVSIVPQFGETPVSDGRLLLIDPPQGHYPPAPRLLEVNVTPPLSAVPRIAWTASHGIRLALAPEFGFGTVPRPAGASIARANSVGPFTITATIGPPLAQLTIPGFAYESIGLGCTSGFAGGYKVDARGVPQQTDTVRDSDIYLTSPVVPELILWNHCSKDFQPPATSNSTLFIPGGAINLPDARGTFSDVDGSRWRGPARHAIDPLLVRGTLLWRTRDGHLMKTLQQSAGENLIGQTIMADQNGRFADNGWLKGARPEQRAVSDTALESLHYATTISDDASPFVQYGMPQLIELLMPYRGGVSFPDRPSSICLHTDPQLFPDPGATWSLVGGLGAASLQPPMLTAAVQALSVPLSSECEIITNPRPGYFTISSSVRAPVSRHVSRRAVIYNSLILTADGDRNALRFVDDHATYVASRTASDLFLSKDSVLHFPSGGTLLTNGTDPSLSRPEKRSSRKRLFTTCCRRLAKRSQHTGRE